MVVAVLVKFTHGGDLNPDGTGTEDLGHDEIDVSLAALAGAGRSRHVSDETTAATAVECVHLRLRFARHAPPLPGVAGAASAYTNGPRCFSMWPRWTL
jgi:hypothetical protein